MTMGREVFVGRSDEISLLHRALADARHNDPRIVVVEGEPGIGKTALLRHFVRDLSDVDVIWASGDESESLLDFGLAQQLLAAMPSGPGASHAADSFAVGAQLINGISTVDSGAALVIVVDDLHWIDLNSSKALLFCLRRLRADPVLVLTAARPLTLQRLGEGWGRLFADRDLVQRIRLAAFTSSEVRQLAAATGVELAPQLGERLREHTAGSPLHVSTLLAELPPADLTAELGELPAPRSYAATVLARMARLSPVGQEFVAAAAILGHRADVGAVTGAAGLPTDSVAIDEAVASGLVRVDRNGAVLFSHPLVRAAIYDDLSPGHRRRLHTAAAVTLDGSAALTHRVAAAAGTVDGQLATELIAAAWGEQARGRLLQAVGFLLASSRVDSDRDRADQSLYQAVELSLMSGDVTGADGLAPLVRARPDTPYRRYVEAILATPTGTFARSVDELTSVVRTIPDTDPALFARCTAALAYSCSMLGDHDAAIDWASRSRAAAGDAPTADALARQALAWGYGKRGDIEAGIALLEDCSPNHAQPDAFEVELLTLRGALRNWSGDLGGASRDLHAVIRWVQQGFPLTGVTHAYAALAEADFRLGDWDTAARNVELAISLADSLDHSWFLAYSRCVAAHLYASRGALDSARRHARATRAVAVALPSIEALIYAALAESYDAWARGDWSAVVTALTPLDRGELMTTDQPNVALWRYRLAEAYLALGQVADAQRLLTEAVERSWGGVTRAERIRLQAQLDHRRGRTDEAVAALAAYAEGIDENSRVLAEGLLALDLGRILLASRQRRAAIVPLQSARAIFLRLGAAGLVDQCDSALVASGLPAGEAGSGGDPVAARLTDREQIVARLVAAGLTNREAAAELYVSVKAIEYHLRNIYTKLGMTSRRQLRDALAGHALSGDVGEP